MSTSWTISVGDRSYGPYSLEQLESFQAQGRLAPYSLVARDQEPFHPASEDTELAALFGAKAQSPTQQHGRNRQPNSRIVARTNSDKAAKPSRTGAIAISSCPI